LFVYSQRKYLAQARYFLWYNFKMQTNSKKRVGVLRGGEGKHYASSLQKGGEIIAHIFENLGDKYKTFDILIDKEGKWHLNGKPIIPADLIHKVDVVWNTSHSNFSNILDNLSILNIGNGFFSFALQNNRDFLREHIKEIGLQIPKYLVSPKNAQEVFEKFPAPWIVKFSNEIKLIKTFNELTDTINNEDDIILEEFSNTWNIPKNKLQTLSGYLYPSN